MEFSSTEFGNLLKLRKIQVKLKHHEMIYKTCLAENVAPRVLRLKREPCLGKVSQHFKRKWRSILRDADESRESFVKETLLGIKQ